MIKIAEEKDSEILAGLAMQMREDNDPADQGTILIPTVVKIKSN